MTKTRDIEDTSKRDPLEHLLGSVGGKEAFSGYIQDMTKDGQQQLVKSSMLPVDQRDTTTATLVGLGFSWGQPPKPGDLFLEMFLPPGWTKVESDHPMWSYIRDEKGRERFSIFYKAAFYDRSAHMGLSRLFYLRTNYDRRSAEKRAVYELAVQVPSSNNETQWKVLQAWVGKVVEDLYSEHGRDDDDAVCAQGRAWLDENYPDHKNPLAYWDKEF